MILVAGSIFSMHVPYLQEAEQKILNGQIKCASCTENDEYYFASDGSPLYRKKMTPLEDELYNLGCVQWSDVGEITPSVLEHVKLFHRVENGTFVLKPGLQLRYSQDIYFDAYCASRYE
ncbi:MAG: hypothetical protein LBT70_02900 [Holosporaceae bacterium]|jgi:hypothetical protein|nr:hypothetical protein [Holosporaceae bacterium]